MPHTSYKEAFNEAERVLRAACVLSAKTYGRPVEERSVELASHIFGKLCVHACAALALAPKGPLGGPAPSTELWDVSSMAVLTRAVVDAYFIMFYLAVDEVDQETREFRFILWDYHSETQRFKQLRLFKSEHPDVKAVERKVTAFKERLTRHSVYLSQEPNRQKDLRKPKKAMDSTNSILAERAGIDPDYCNAVYVYLSNYVHTHGFALTQLAKFQAGTPEALREIKVVVEFMTGFLCLGVRDFLKLCPDQRSIIEPETMSIVDAWDSLVHDFSNFRPPSVCTSPSPHT